MLAYLFGFLILLAIVGYKYINYKFDNYQELGYEKMGQLDIEESKRTYPDSIKMKEEQFWKLISLSKVSYPKDPEKQVQFLIEDLSKLSDKEIVGFECAFREKMIVLWDYNIKSLYQITESNNYVSTDDFIYFRAYLISLGEEDYYKALTNTDSFDYDVNRSYWSGEGMISVASKAYNKKHKKIDEDNYLGDIIYEVDYDFGNYKMTGAYVHPNDFGKRYKYLTEKYL